VNVEALIYSMNVVYVEVLESLKDIVIVMGTNWIAMGFVGV
jgi:hypothetical protein